MIDGYIINTENGLYQYIQYAGEIKYKLLKLYNATLEITGQLDIYIDTYMNIISFTQAIIYLVLM